MSEIESTPSEDNPTVPEPFELLLARLRNEDYHRSNPAADSTPAETEGDTALESEV